MVTRASKSKFTAKEIVFHSKVTLDSIIIDIDRYGMNMTAETESIAIFVFILDEIYVNLFL